MEKRFSLSLGHIWLLIALFLLVLPIFMPSSANPQNFTQNVIGTTTVTMFILSFPSSLFGLPVLFFAGAVLDVDQNSIAGMYLNLFLLFVLGLVQWFWIAPRLARSEPRLQLLNLIAGKSEMPLPETSRINARLPQASDAGNIPFCDAQGRTPLERVFQEKENEG